MNLPRAILLVLLACLYQGLAGHLYRIGTAVPDFSFLALLYLGFFAPPGPFLLLAAVTAGGLDLASLDPFGTRLLGYLPVLWLMNRLRRGFLTESPLLRLPLCFGACLLAFSLEALFLGWKENVWLGAGFEVRSALYTAVISVAVFPILDSHRASLGWSRDRYFASGSG